VGLATGHYARIADDEDGPLLARPADETKDQTYMLSALRPSSLARLRFPLADLTKPEVREIAADAGLEVAGRAESQDLCFLAGQGKRRFLRRHAGLGDRRGEVVDRAGHRLGAHRGHHNFTVGQRRGLGVAAAGRRAGERLYVLAVDPAANRVTAGGAADLACRGLVGGRLHWINPELDLAAGDAASRGVEATVKLRSRHPGVGCLVRPRPGGGCEVDFAEPQAAVAPGQAAVFYRGTRVLGGCWIERGVA
jgi:tRNA-specific 2-thiouridylase